jgi:hypothetical protein
VARGEKEDGGAEDLRVPSIPTSALQGSLQFD